jgi:cytochrome bd-type quinol oxidase subunit 1
VNQFVQNNLVALDLENMVLSLDALKDRDFSVQLLFTLSHCAVHAFAQLPTGYHCAKYAKRNLTSDYGAFFNFVATISFYHNHDAVANSLSVFEYAKQHDMYVKGVNQEFEVYKQALHASATYNKTWYGPIKPASLHIYLTPRQTQQRLLFAYSIPWRVNEFSNNREHNISHKYKCFTGWLPVFQQLKYAFWKE